MTSWFAMVLASMRALCGYGGVAVDWWFVDCAVRVFGCVVLAIGGCGFVVLASGFAWHGF